MFSIRFFLTAIVLLHCSAPRLISGGALEYDISPDSHVRQIAPGIWLHTWWMETPTFGRFTSNGLVIVSKGEAMLIDTPVNDDMTERLLRWIGDSLKVPVRRAILTHAHDDRMGGIRALKRAGIISYALPATADWAERQGWPRPDSLLGKQQLVPIGGRTVLTWFPGPGHTPDNIVVWLKSEKILYGGCLVKAHDAGSIGNVADANMEQWPVSIRRLVSRFPTAKVVIPGHGPVAGKGALKRTLDLLKEQRALKEQRSRNKEQR